MGRVNHNEKILNANDQRRPEQFAALYKKVKYLLQRLKMQAKCFNLSMDY